MRPVRGSAGTVFRLQLAYLFAAVLVTAIVNAPADAFAGEKEQALILPALTPLEWCAECPPPRRPDPAKSPRVSEWARALDTLLVEGARDLGLTPSALPEDVDPTEMSPTELADDRWVFSPRVAASGTQIALRLVAVPPGSGVELSVTERMAPRELEVRAMVMMRDLVRTVRPAEARARRPRPPARRPRPAPVEEARSDGRAVLAFNGAALGGYVGFTLQGAGGSEDARLTYPLIALGTGIGLGGALIVSEEWDIGMADAWYLSAGTWWPTFGAVMVARSYDRDKGDRHVIGLGAGAGGLALATTSLAFGPMSDGGAVMAHSGGAFGTLLGALTELAVDGTTDETPLRGMGFGSMSGVLAAGTAARFLPRLSPSRLLLIDLSAGIGGLAGAAVASPAVFGEDITARENRIWLSSIASGIVLGGGIGVFVTKPSNVESKAPQKHAARWLPFGGAIGRDRENNPVLGGGVTGTW